MTIQIVGKDPLRPKEPLIRTDWQVPDGTDSLRKLLTALVEASLAAFLERPGDRPLTDEELERMAALGKIAFGFHYNEAIPDRDGAVETALQAWTDGLVRVWRNGTLLEDLDDHLALAEQDELLLLRLTFLTGRLW